MDLLDKYTNVTATPETITRALYNRNPQDFMLALSAQAGQLRHANSETFKRALGGLAFLDAHTHLERMHFLIQLVMQNAATVFEVLPTLRYLATVADAAQALPYLENLTVPSDILQEFRDLVTFQGRTRRIRSGTLETEDLEGLVFAAVTQGLEGKRIKIDFDWTTLQNRPGCAYHVSEILGPDPNLVDTVDKVILENPGIVAQAENGDKSAVQNLLSLCLKSLYEGTRSLMDSETVLEILLNHTRIGENYAQEHDR